MSLSTAPTPDRAGRWIITKFGTPDVLKWEPFDSLPVPSKGEVLIRILVAGISGADNIQRAGGYPDPRTQAPGFTPGYDFVGRIETLGPFATEPADLQSGNLVTAMCMIGSYATHIVLPINEVIKLQDHDDPIKVCALPLNYMTAYGMLMRSGATLTPGDSVLIGSVSGGVGSAVAQLARTFDMGLTLYGTCSPSKFDYIRSLGVIPIDRHTADLPARIKELTGGKGVDVAYDAVGSEKSMRDSYAATKEGTGRVVVIGVMDSIASDGSGMTDTGFNPFAFIGSGVLPRLRFWAVTRDYYVVDKDLWLKDFERIVSAVRDGKLVPTIGKLYKLSDAIEANEQLVSGVGVTGKLEFIVDAEMAKAQGLLS